MSYQVIARKYRPQTFEDVVGQKPIVTTLRNAVTGSRLHHAYLFSGPRGIGKTTVARLLAKSLNCAEGPTATPCNKCSSCAEITQSRSMDVLEIDGASNRGIDDIRELRETVRYAPARDRYKVFIIDEVHMLTDPAWNALLKTLEEPPPNVVFVFATTEYREIPRTILSRCQHFEFRKVAPAEMLAHLREVAKGEKVAVEPGALDLIARVAEGSLRDALSALDQVIAFSGDTVGVDEARTILGVVDRELILDFVEAVRTRDSGRIVGIVDAIYEKGYQPVEFLEDLMGYTRDLLLARTVADPGRFIAGTAEEIAALTARAAGFDEDALLRMLEILTREEGRLKHSAHARYLLEALGIRLARLADLAPVEELLARLEGGGSPVAPGPGGGGPTSSRPRPGPGTSNASPFAPAPTASAAPAPTAPAPATPAWIAPQATVATPVGDAGDRAPLSALRAVLQSVPSPAAPKKPAAGGPTGATLRAVPPPADEPPTAAVEPAAAGVPPVAITDAPFDPADPLEAIRRQVHQERSSLGSILDQAAGIEIAGDTLRILYAPAQAFFRDKVKSRESLDLLRRVARAAAGRPIAIEVETAGPGVRTAPAPRPLAGLAPIAPAHAPGDGRAGGPRSADDPERHRLFEQASREPAVRSLLEVFGGEIIDIEPLV